jgi:hypothetical protein
MIELFMMLVGVVIGCFLTIVTSFFLKKREDKLKKKNVELLFTEIRDNINFGNSFFSGRVNDSVHIKMNLKSLGNVSVFYFIDKKDVSIFIGNKCIYTSQLVNKDLLSSISYNIESKFHKELNDVVNVFGILIDRKSFISMGGTIKEKESFDENFEDEINDLDEILDKINVIGYDNLTLNEKKFLENYGKD